MKPNLKVLALFAFMSGIAAEPAEGACVHFDVHNKCLDAAPLPAPAAPAQRTRVIVVSSGYYNVCRATPYSNGFETVYRWRYGLTYVTAGSSEMFTCPSISANDWVIGFGFTFGPPGIHLPKPLRHPIGH